MAANPLLTQIDNLIFEGARIRNAGNQLVEIEEAPRWPLGYAGERNTPETRQYTKFDEVALQQWKNDIKMVAVNAAPPGHHIVADAHKLDNYYNEALLDDGTALLQSLKKNLQLGLLVPVQVHGSRAMDTAAAIGVIERISVRFHEVVKRLRRRHDGRPTLEVTDEYDFQDLLHSLLLVTFDDVRVEEWTPSTAGATARMDLILKAHRIVIETKMMRKGLTDRKLTEELLVDLGLYPAHPDCGHLVMFIYDPDERIGNPATLHDIEKRGSVPVSVLISPCR